MTKSKKKIIFLSTSFILTICLMGFMGVYALTTLKNSQINVGITYQPEYLVKVEMGIDGANDGTDDQTIEETEYVEIYNSLNPVSNGMYIQSISSDTIRLEANSLTPDSTGLVYFRFYILDGETKDIIASVNCGETTETTQILTTTATQLSIQTGVTADNPALIGALKINIKFEEIPCYTVYEYASGTGPVYDNNNTSNRYVHYIEMGEYPQTYYGTSLPAESEYEITTDYYYNSNSSGIIKSTLYKDKTTGQKFAKQGTNFYNVEPMRWIVLGVSDGNPKSDGNHILFTSGNTDNWRYNEATKKFQIKNDNEWINVDEVLLLSEFCFAQFAFDENDTTTRFSQSSLNTYLNTTIFNSMFNSMEQNKIVPQKMYQTTYNAVAEINSNSEYNLFLLGSNFYTKTVNSSNCFSKILNKSKGFLESQIYAPDPLTLIFNLADSYNIKSYFAPTNSGSSSGDGRDNQGSNQSNLIAKQTAFCASQTQMSSNDYIKAKWWLRTGAYYSLKNIAILISTSGSFFAPANTSVADINGIRPAMVLNVS